MSRPQVIDAAVQFELSTAIHLAAAAELAYATPEVIGQTATTDWQALQVTCYDVESTQCLLAVEPDSLVVAFRGTEGDKLEDWIADLEFELVPGPLNGRVHAGFYDALACVWQLLDREVRRLQAAQPRRLWVTGHSLGAALAALAAARWCEAGVEVAGLYTFGQPRTGDANFTRNLDFAFRSQAFRVVNNRDIVTRTPPRSLGYQHLGTLIYLTESGELSHDVGWWQRFLSHCGGGIEGILDWGKEGLEDHRIAHYRQRLENQAKPRSQDLTVASGPHPAAAPEPHILSFHAPIPKPRVLPALIKPRRRSA